MNSVVSQDSVFIASDTKLIPKWLQKKTTIQLMSHIIKKFNDSGSVGARTPILKSQLCLYLLFHFKLSIPKFCLPADMRSSAASAPCEARF